MKNIQKFDEEFRIENDAQQVMRRNKETIEQRISELRDEKIPAIEENTKDAKENLAKIKRKSKEESLGDYTDKLSQKKEYEEIIREQSGILESHFGLENAALHEIISRWEEAVEDLEKFKEKSKEVSYDERLSSKLKERSRECDEELNKLREQMTNFRDELSKIEQEANKVL